MNFAITNVDEISTDTSSSSDNDEANPKKKLKVRKELSQDLKSKFDSLKQRNAKIKERYQKRYASKNIQKEIKKYAPQIDSSSTSLCKTSLDTKNETLKSLNANEKKAINKLENQIDKAIANSNIELAEKLSDNLFQQSSLIEQRKQHDRLIYETDVLSKRMQKSQEKKKLNWRFEAKQKWETKSNM